MVEKKKISVDMNRYDPDFNLALQILDRHLATGNADTNAIPECLAGLIKVIRENVREDSKDE